MNKLITLFIMAAILAACMFGQAARLDGTTWQLVELGGEAVPLLAAERQPFLEFAEDTVHVNGYSGCNNFFGKYDQDGSTITFGPLAMTRRFCAGPANDVERRFMEALHTTRTWTLTNGSLEFLSGDGEILAQFE